MHEQQKAALEQNLKAFQFFRIFFNARFYYPVFMILFKDYGITDLQFMILNAVWAVTIVLLEVPSGALADTIGRKPLMLLGAACMIIEMLTLVFAPIGGGTVLFILMLINRIISGLAEAMVSGADEALAYDSMKKLGREKEWSDLLSKLMQRQSIAMLIAMLLGGLVYDPSALQYLADTLGMNVNIEKADTIKLPIYLCLATSFIVLWGALRMTEVPTEKKEECSKMAACSSALRNTTALTIKAAKWILKTPVVLTLIVAGFLFDSIIRTFLTIISQYLRVIEIPEAAFGVFSSLMSVFGIVAPIIAKRLIKNTGPIFNFTILAVSVWIGLIGLSFAWPWWGLFPIIFVTMPFNLLNFFMSHYLNERTSSEMRATVLSFKSLAFNIAYAIASLAFGLLLARLNTGDSTNEQVFVNALAYLPGYFLVTMLALAMFAKVVNRPR